MKYTFWDLAGWAFTGALVMAFIWFCEVSYQEAHNMGYTPAARAHMDILVVKYSEPDWDNIRPLSVQDLE